MVGKQILNSTVIILAVAVIVLVATHLRSTNVRADEQDSDRDLAAIGLKIAPDFVKVERKDAELFGLGSFIVNAQVDCNGCHGSDPANEFRPKHNPYFLPPDNYPVKFNQATYVNGGQNFGPVGPGIVADVSDPLYAGPGLGPNIITRNLTPDYTGNPAGGMEFSKFIKVMRTGHDYDKLHLNCGGKVTDRCYFAPVNGAVLQVMPWPKFQHMTDHQLTAIWTYLRAVPCNAHNDTLGVTFPWLQNVCP